VAEVAGECHEAFGAVRDTLAASIERGDDLGASVAVTVDGELVVDVWGGWVDAARTTPWERDTITNVWSTTKTVAALCVLILVDEGEIDLDSAVSRYWPEFAAGGKGGRVLVRHVLGHTSGLAGWTEPISIKDLYDWEKMTSLLAAQEPWWEPGSRSGYHAVSQGYLVGELVRRVTGQSIGTFLEERVTGPLQADFHVGLGSSEAGRVAEVFAPPPMDLSSMEIPPFALQVLNNPLIAAETANTGPWQRAEIPAANGHGNARSVATIQAAVANGGELGGVRLLSSATCERILEEQSDGVDGVLGQPLRFGVGYALPSASMPLAPNSRTCYWGGWGGSVVVLDMDSRATFAYVMNKMGDGLVSYERGAALGLAALAGLARYRSGS
jgi:CubicO group peptidase (beta-lactamase class C family)